MCWLLCGWPSYYHHCFFLPSTTTTTTYETTTTTTTRTGGVVTPRGSAYSDEDSEASTYTVSHLLMMMILYKIYIMEKVLLWNFNVCFLCLLLLFMYTYMPTRRLNSVGVISRNRNEPSSDHQKWFFSSFYTFIGIVGLFVMYQPYCSSIYIWGLSCML